MMTPLKQAVLNKTGRNVPSWNKRSGFFDLDLDISKLEPVVISEEYELKLELKCRFSGSGDFEGKLKYALQSLARTLYSEVLQELQEIEGHLRFDNREEALERVVQLQKNLMEVQ